MTKEQYWYWLAGSPEIFRTDIERILLATGSVEAAFYADKEELLRNKVINQKQKESLQKRCREGGFSEELERLKEEGVRFLYPESPDYPERLKTIPDRPFALYVKGQLPDPELPTVGMVGARACSEYGKSMATRFSKALAKAGVQIVSGMALGIDGICGKGALSAGGKTFAVLGSGVDVIYPLENFGLYYEILASGGGIISEYPMGTPAIGWQFPARNRIISGLSDRLLVIEAKERSGTLITVRYALEQGRDVYALPGRVTDSLSAGCNKMIADGAGVLLSPAELLSEIFRREVKEETLPPPQLEQKVRKVYDLLGTDPVSVDFIIKNCRITPAQAGAFLAELELSGLVREVSKNHYVKTFLLDT